MLAFALDSLTLLILLEKRPIDMHTKTDTFNSTYIYKEYKAKKPQRHIRQPNRAELMVMGSQTFCEWTIARKQQKISIHEQHKKFIH